MNILLTGATGYIGKRLLPTLLEQGHTVYCCVRDKKRYTKQLHPNQQVIEVDFLNEDTLKNIPQEIDVAYYLIHSMSSSSNYEALEYKCAVNFKETIAQTNAQQVIYLSGIVNEKQLSKHLNSRLKVEQTLASNQYNLTTLRAGIIIGSGSASFEIIRDIVEKLPIMIAPKWLLTKCQPIAIRNVIELLYKTMLHKDTYNQSFDIGSNDILSYKDMLLGYAKVRQLKRKIFIVPVMTPKLSSYWLYFVTSTSFLLASALVSSMKVEVVCRNNDLLKLLGVRPISYEEAIARAFNRIKQNTQISSWKDAFINGQLEPSIQQHLMIPKYGCFRDYRTRTVTTTSITLDKIWAIGGDNGWYVGDWLWKIRGYLDKIVGGVGLRRGRTHPTHIETGSALDFWRVLYADKDNQRLLLYAEMKLPGEAWLEFKIKDGILHQNATFRPKGVLGRLYWYAVTPFHGFIFKGMINYLAKAAY